VKQDPLALAFFGAALALLAGLLAYVIFFKTPEPATPVRAFDFLLERFGREPAVKPRARPAAPPGAAPAIRLEAGRSWRYAVVVEPPIWRDVTLTYRTRREGSGLGVLTDFVYAGGKMNFHLGTFAAGHPSHANTRFPGFFMHASYFPPVLKEGQRLAWGWAWQPERAGRVKRYAGTVARRETVRVPAGAYTAAVIEAELSYIEGGKVRAKARETLWYVPELSQVVRVVREGRTPDEGSTRIVAELAELR